MPSPTNEEVLAAMGITSLEGEDYAPKEKKKERKVTPLGGGWGREENLPSLGGAAVEEIGQPFVKNVVSPALETIQGALEWVSGANIIPNPNAAFAGLVNYGERMRGEPETQYGATGMTSLKNIGERVKQSGQGFGGPLGVAAEFAGSEIQNLPFTLALGGIGKVGKAADIIGSIGKIFEKTPGLKRLKYQAGYDPKSKELFDVAYTKTGLARTESAESAQKIRETAQQAAKKMKNDELAQQDLIAGLMEQTPQKRDEFRAWAQQPFDLSTVPAKYDESMAYKHAFTARGANAWEKNITPTHVDVADEMAKVFGRNRQDMIKLGIKDPDFFARHNEFNYAPVNYKGQTVGWWPSIERVRVDPKGLKFREDLTREARMKYGQVPLADAVALTNFSQRQAIINEELFQGLARVPGVVLPDMGNLEIGKEIMQGGIKYMKMPTDKAYGSLAGMLVKIDEAKDIKGAVDFYNNPSNLTKVFRDMMSTWKFGKTIVSAKTQVANFFSNAMLAHAAGLSPYRADIYARAAKSMMDKGDDFYREAKQIGAPWAQKFGLGTQEFADLYTFKGDEPMYVQLAHKMAQFMKGNIVSQKAADLYQFNEAFFKQAVYINSRMKGLSPSDAVKWADDAIINYDKVPLLIKQARTMAIPFITFSYAVTPKIAQIMVERPQFFYHYKLFAEAFNAAQAANYQISESDMEEMRNLYPGSLPLLTGRDAFGKPHVHDVGRFSMVNDLGAMLSPVTGFTPGARVGPTTGNPLVDLASNIVSRNPVVGAGVGGIYGYDIQNKTQFAKPFVGPSGIEQYAKSAGIAPENAAQLGAMGNAAQDKQIRERMQYLARLVLPDLLGGGGFQSVKAAMEGQTNFMGQKQDLTEAVRGLVFGRGRDVTTDTIINARRLGVALAQSRQGIQEVVGSMVQANKSPEEIRQTVEAYMKAIGEAGK